MSCGSHLHHWAVVVAVAGGCLALIGGYAIWVWRPMVTQRLVDAFREVEAERPRRRWSWSGIAWRVLSVVVFLALLAVIHPYTSVYVLLMGTVIPIGVIDMGQTEHCRAVATGKPLHKEWNDLNGWAMRLAPILVPAGVAIALVATVVAVLATLC